MALRMTLPWRHPTHGVWYARLWVPADLKPIVKKDEVRRSLRTKDPTEAKRIFKQVVAEIETEWEQLRQVSEFVRPVRPARALTQMEAHGLAGEFYRSTVAAHQDNPGDPKRWEAEISALQRMLPAREREPGSGVITFGPWSVGSNSAARMLGPEVRTFLDARDDNLDAPSFVRLCGAVALAKRDAYAQLHRNAMGDFAADPRAARFPTLPEKSEQSNASTPLSREPVGVEELLEGWRTLASPKHRTFKSWSGKLRMLMRFAQKEDVSQLTKLDVERWRDERIKNGINPSTVAMGDLAGVRNVLAWAKEHTSLPGITENVAAEVKQKVPKTKVKLRSKSFTFMEAKKILSATLLPVSGRYTQARAGAQRWVPWLCAYSGARVGEIAQMHSCRIAEHELPDGKKYWCMEITPLDGDVKDSEARTIPLHSHVIEQGFLDYAKRRQKVGKPLFYEPELGRGAETHRQANKVGDRLGQWVREDLKIVGVQPNHGWRHRFETISRNKDIREDVIDHITGHEGADVSAKYGDFLIEALSKAIEKMPRYEVTTSISARSGGVSAQ